MRAFDYSESFERKLSIRNAEYIKREKSIAWEYVNQHKCNNKTCQCRVCGSNDVKYIFQRWDVNYYICNECSSVFIPVDKELMKEYLSLDSMRSLRISADYQEDATQRRKDLWDEFERWMTFRIYRYTQRKEGLIIIDYADRYEGQINVIKNSKLCNQFILIDSILDNSNEVSNEYKGDVVLYLNQLQHESSPLDPLQKIHSLLKQDGLLILSTRLGSGFDILTLKGDLDSIFPYEHVLLPSKRGVEILLSAAGFDLLEFLTPGTLDVKYVLDNIERVDESCVFIKELLKSGDQSILVDFQRLLQKAGFSSFAQIIAMKKYV